MKFLRSNSGSSSILVAMVLTILVVFSALAVTTSVSNLRLAEKNANTTAIYYNLDSDGERFLYEIRKDVENGVSKAKAAVNAFERGDFTDSNLPDSISGIIVETLAGTTTLAGKKQYLDDLAPKLATYYSQLTISQAYPDSVSDSAADYLNDPAIYGDKMVELSFDVKRSFILENESICRYLNVTLNISDPSGEKKSDEICTVREWRLWQEPFEYKNEVDLWEGRP